MVSYDGLISVVIPTFNSEKYIKQTVLSVLDQTYDKIEIIVVDDCSTDNTELSIKSLINDRKVRFYKMKSNSGGPAGPRNLGIEKSKGDWIAFLDSDDLWHPLKLEFQMRILKEKNELFICSSKINFHDECPENVKLNKPKIFTINYKVLLLKDFIPTSSVILNKSLLNQNKFNEIKDLISVEDFALWLDILRGYQINCLKLKLPLTYYRISENQISKNKIKRIKKFIKMYQIHFDSQSMIYAKSFLFTFSHYLIATIEKLKK